MYEICRAQLYRCFSSYVSGFYTPSLKTGDSQGLNLTTGYLTTPSVVLCVRMPLSTFPCQGLRTGHPQLTPSSPALDPHFQVFGIYNKLFNQQDEIPSQAHNSQFSYNPHSPSLRSFSVDTTITHPVHHGRI